MTRRDWQRLEDIITAIDAIAGYVSSGSIDDGLVYDACRIRLLEIGEAIKNVSESILDQRPGIPWQDIAGMRDHLAHRYFDTDHAIVRHTIEVELPVLRAAVVELAQAASDPRLVAKRAAETDPEPPQPPE